jgi:hypothetical protein
MLARSETLRSGRWRRLAAGECALAARVFGQDLDAGRVRLLAVPLWSRAFVAGGGPAAYAYDLAAGVRFAALNLEQQAMVVEDAFRRLNGLAAPHAADLYAAVLEDALPDLASRLRRSWDA